MNHVTPFPFALAIALGRGADLKKSVLWDVIGIFWFQVLLDFVQSDGSLLTKNVPALDTILAINSFTNLESATEIQVFSLNLYEPN